MADFDREMSRLRPVLLLHGLRLLKNRDEAEDLVQEVSVRLFRAWDRIDKETLEAFAVRVATRRFLDMKRAQGRRIDPLLPSQMIHDDTRHRMDNIPDETDLQAELLREAEANDLDNILEALPECQRSVMRLIARGWSYLDVARGLQIPAATVRSRAHRARKALCSAA